MIRIFDDMRREQAKHLYDYSFSEHTLRVTDIATGYGGCNAIIVSASEDRTCKVRHVAYFIVLMIRCLIFNLMTASTICYIRFGAYLRGSY